jgi:hypothetical protein
MCSGGKRISSDIWCCLDVDAPPTLTIYEMMLATKEMIFRNTSEADCVNLLLMILKQHSDKNV